MRLNTWTSIRWSAWPKWQTPSLKHLFDWPMSHLLTWRGEGLMSCTAASHLGAVLIFWHTFGELACRPSLCAVNEPNTELVGRLQVRVFVLVGNKITLRILLQCVKQDSIRKELRVGFPLWSLSILNLKQSTQLMIRELLLLNSGSNLIWTFVMEPVHPGTKLPANFYLKKKIRSEILKSS